MSTGFFGDITKIPFEGEQSDNPLAFRHYNPDEVVAGKRMEDHLRFAVCYWHNFAWPGSDPFGGLTFERPWFDDISNNDPMANAKLKADIAFEMFTALGVPYFCFHDADVRPEGSNFKENTDNLNHIVDYFEQKMSDTGMKLLWGTANLFSHRRFMAGAATNPNPDIFAFAAATVKTCIENEVKMNIEQGHAILAGHTFEHELALAADLGIFGSIDMNRNDYQSGWDTDQFPNNVPEMALAYYQILKAGGFSTGGTNFDAKLRRQSIEPDDLLIAHIGGMDCCARGLKAAAAIIEDGTLDKFIDDRYCGWDDAYSQRVLNGEVSLEELAAKVEKEDVNPQPVSGRQEYLENLVNRFV